MDFNPHSSLAGQHAFLGASKYSWVRYSEDKLIQTYINNLAIEKGTRLHELAKELITLRINLPKTKATLNMYVNDAIGFRMTPEQVLYYSEFCFGTADAIAFNDRKRYLRIHDLKTGSMPAHMEQLEIYTALFYLEYGKFIDFIPSAENTELRIYQSDEIIVHHPESSVILDISDKIVTFSQLLEKVSKEE